MGRRPAATGDSAPAGGWSSGMHPPSSSRSPLSSVSACGENCAALAPPLPTARGAAGALSVLPKRNGPCTVQKKRPLRRAPARSCLRATGVGGSVQAPILACLRARFSLLQVLGLPSRGGWCGGRRGGHRIVSAPLFAAAGLAVDGGFCNGPMRTSAPTGKTRDFTCSLGRTYVLAFVGCRKP